MFQDTSAHIIIISRYLLSPVQKRVIVRPVLGPLGGAKVLDFPCVGIVGHMGHWRRWWGMLLIVRLDRFFSKAVQQLSANLLRQHKLHLVTFGFGHNWDTGSCFSVKGLNSWKHDTPGLFDVLTLYDGKSHRPVLTSLVRLRE